MTFGSNHYVPILKLKRGEKAALGRVAPNRRSRITPLLQVVERTPDKAVEAHIETAFKDLAANAALYPRCFIDVQEIAADGPVAAAAVFDRASAAGIIFSPVTSVTRITDVAAALNNRQHGLALRLTRAEFEEGALAQRIATFLSTHQVTAGEIDLIIDLGAVEEMIADGVAALAGSFLAEVPHQEDWRTFTLSACAFPISMGGVERHSHDLVERVDWLAWRDSLYTNRGGLTRLPSYSDYAIQHPSGVEGFDPRIMQVSATIRYTTDEHWLLIKGESTRSVRPGEQFPELATRLVYGHLHSYFAGPGHCNGCKSMKEAADGVDGYGSAEVWRRLGTIHHLSKVIDGLDSLTWP